MSEKYDFLVDTLNRTKHNVSVFDKNIQRKVALCMWDYVRDHLDELHDMLTDEEIDSGDNDYGYDAVEKIKEDFCHKFEEDTGIVIDWDNECILCDKYAVSPSPQPCIGCPLVTCAAYTDNPYHTLVEYAFHNKDRSSALSAINTIISTIKKEDFTSSCAGDKSAHDDWERYIKYLHEWAEDHSDFASHGMSPVSFDEWCEIERGYEDEQKEM